MGIKSFNPKNVTISLTSPALGAHVVSGYDNGQFINVEFESDSYTHEAGADGEELRVKNNDRRAIATITLLQSSDSTKFLSDVENLDRYSDAGVIGFYLKDTSNGETIATEGAWVKKRAPWSRDIAKTTSVWELSLKSPAMSYEGAAEN